MRGTLSLSDELTGELRNEFDAISISDLGSLRLLAGKLSPEAFGLLQQYRSLADIAAALPNIRFPAERGLRERLRGLEIDN